MSVNAADDLEVRLSALAARIERSGEQLEVWIEPLSIVRKGARDGPDTAPNTRAAAPANEAPVQQLRERVQAAESSANLQAQRCLALEDRIAMLESQLSQERAHRQRAESQLEAARATASELEAERSSPGIQPTPDSEQSGPLVATLQSKLLENDRLRAERDNLRRSLGEWREQARTLRRQRDAAKGALDSTQAKLEQLLPQTQGAQERIADLERTLAEQTRELEVARARTEHMRERMRVGAR